jgi:uncharacterized protein (DUF486 family)
LALIGKDFCFVKKFIIKSFCFFIICFSKLVKIKNMTPFYTISLLLLSNIFMTFAWYGHLKFKTTPLLIVIFISWGIAFFEYCLQVPANRIGHGYFNAAQLKTIQEIITLVVFAVFSVFYLNEPLKWNHFVGFIFLVLAAAFIFKN